MATAPNLPSAANQAFDVIFPLWSGGNNLMKDSLTAFSVLVLAIFPDSDPVGRPLGNWGAVISSLANQIPLSVGPVDYQLLVTAADYVYRVCWLGTLSPGSPAITVGQQTELLAAFNASF